MPTTLSPGLDGLGEIFMQQQTPKRIAILSSGPSLLRHDPAELFDLRIGVNRAATRFACDWWSVGDAQAFWRHIDDRENDRQGLVIGRPRILTLSPTWGEVMHADRALFDSFPEWMIWEKLRDLMQPPEGWDLYSAGVALILAGYLAGPGGEVIAFGCDMQDEPGDFAGFHHGSRYNPERWERERKIWRRLTEWLLGRGVICSRILADGRSDSIERSLAHA